MDGTNAAGPLPERYANALLMRDRGLDPARIARRLDIPSEAIGSFLLVAEAKLAHALTSGAENGEGRRC